MGQRFDWLNETKAITECNEQKCDNKYTFSSKNQFWKVKSPFKSGRIAARENLESRDRVNALIYFYTTFLSWQLKIAAGPKECQKN